MNMNDYNVFKVILQVKEQKGLKCYKEECESEGIAKKGRTENDIKD